MAVFCQPDIKKGNNIIFADASFHRFLAGEHETYNKPTVWKLYAQEDNHARHNYGRFGKTLDQPQNPKWENERYICVIGINGRQNSERTNL